MRTAVMVKQKWKILKQLVIEQKYCYSSMSELWQIIINFHKDPSPNLITLAQIAFVMPVHTADGASGFSSQNLVKTALRNRMSSQWLQILNTIKLNGPPLDKFDFRSALKCLKNAIIQNIIKTKSNLAIAPPPTAEVYIDDGSAANNL